MMSENPSLYNNRKEGLKMDKIEIVKPMAIEEESFRIIDKELEDAGLF